MMGDMFMELMAGPTTVAATPPQSSHEGWGRQFSMGVKLGRCDLETGRISLGTVKFGRNTDVKYPKKFELPEDKVIVDLLSEAQDPGGQFA